MSDRTKYYSIYLKVFFILESRTRTDDPRIYCQIILQSYALPTELFRDNILKFLDISIQILINIFLNIFLNSNF